MRLLWHGRRRQRRDVLHGNRHARPGGPVCHRIARGAGERRGVRPMACRSSVRTRDRQGSRTTRHHAPAVHDVDLGSLARQVRRSRDARGAGPVWRHPPDAGVAHAEGLGGQGHGHTAAEPVRCPRQTRRTHASRLGDVASGTADRHQRTTTLVRRSGPSGRCPAGFAPASGTRPFPRLSASTFRASLFKGHGSPDRGAGGCPRAQPHAGIRTLDLRPHHLNSNRGWDNCACFADPCNTAVG